MLTHGHVFVVHDGIVPTQLETLAAAVKDANVLVGNSARIIQRTPVLVQHRHPELRLLSFHVFLYLYMYILSHLYR